MPRRTSARTVTSPAAPQALPVLPQPETPYDANIHQLRRHWKWAAFSQFFFTFSPLLAMADVTLTDVENDLVHSTNRVLSRIMQRLLITLTQDRKITTDSWQNVLRRQYQRRNPEASPIGLPARSQYFTVESSRASTAPLGATSEMPLSEAERENEPSQLDQPIASPAGKSDDVVHDEGSIEDERHNFRTKVEEEEEALDALEKQIDWLDLSMLAKLESLHILAEWQFQNPNRVRQQMKTDDEQAAWRIEPIGYDAKRNAYWLIGDERLWIQREPPRPSLKRKRKPSGKSAKKQRQSSSSKRQRVEAIGQSPAARPTRDKAKSQLTTSPRGARAAKTRANQKLDAQAKDIAEFKGQMAASRTSTTTRKLTGIRVSARLRGAAVQDDEWQAVPDEWLATSATHQRHIKDAPFGLLSLNKKEWKSGIESEDSSISELTELSDGENDAEGAERDPHEETLIDEDETNQENGKNEIEDQPDEAELIDSPATPLLPDDFVEWETICVTLEEWESIGQQFEKATHYAEKALYKVLSQSIVPMVTAELREAEKKRRKEDAVVHRKRSSRIAMKEIEKEEERVATRKRIEEDERTSRTRRLEARQQREQAERLKRENAREQRRKEHESKEQQSSEEAESKPGTSMDIIQKDTSSSLPLGDSKTLITLNPVPINGTGSGSRSPVENWILDCEVCGRKGVNQDDGVPLLCCGTCGKWQHIVCHDKQDTMAGHPKRNWDAEDFICRQCRPIRSNAPSSSPASFLSFGVSGNRGQVSNSHTLYVSSSDHRKSYSNNGYHQDSPSNVRYPCDQPEAPAIIPSPLAQSYPSQAHSAAVTFAHYQPQQGGFSTSRPTYSVQDVHPPQHSRYAVTPHAIPAGTAYPSTVQAVTHSPTLVHDQWPPSSYPRTSSSYPLNGESPVPAQGVHPYYNGHAHTAYSHIRGTTNSTVLGQYAGFQHVPSYQRSK